MRGDVVWRLLKKNISVWQTAGYAVAAFVGLSVVLCSMQFYRDLHSGRGEEDPYMSRDYMVLSRKVGMLDAFGGGKSFSRPDVEEIAAQPWAERVGEFKAADFNVAARVALGSRPLSTALFLESVPDEFFDIAPSGWGFSPGRDNVVPIVINKDYLTLYNYGFAASAGLPQLSEGMIGMVPLELSLSGNGRQRWMRGKIVGFSSRLNTIAVPESFMDWANGEFGEGNSGDGPSRVIVETKSAGNPAVIQWLEDKGYEVGGDKGAAGKASYLLGVVSGVVAGIGGVICLLALGILLLSVWLLLQKKRSILHCLMLQGYTPGEVSRRYELIIGVVNLLVLVGALAVVACVSPLWGDALGAVGAGGAGMWPTVFAGAGVMTAVSAINYAAVEWKVRGAFRG